MEKRRYLSYCLADKDLKSTVVNRRCLSLNGDPLEITSTVPLKHFKISLIIKNTKSKMDQSVGEGAWRGGSPGKRRYGLGMVIRTDGSDSVILVNGI